jgi:23S rRNA (uracil1939-C5)-methyltransferase
VSSVPPVVKPPLQLTVEKLVYGGDGLARLPADEHGRGKAVFIPFVLEGEQVEATLTEEKPGFSRARAEKILEASAHRIEPGCPYFQRCGGCHYQHTSYGHQLGIKAAILKENLRRIAKLELDKEPIIHPSPPWNYRNRSRLKLQTEPEFALGYFKFNSHELLPVEQCPISSPLINRAITEFWKWGRASQITVPLQEVEFFANAEDSELLVELFCAPEVSEDSAKQTAAEIHQILPQIVGVVVSRQSAQSARQGNGEPERLAVSGGSELVYRAERASYRVSAGAFFQVNRCLIDELVGLVTEAGSGEVAVDLYAGGGLFSSVLAEKFAQVIAVEPSQISYPDLLHNSPANVKTVCATSDQYLQKAGRLRPDLLVVDPPRSGLGASVVKGLVALRAPRITYVSCDPATLARDLSGLLGGGYRVEQAHLVDLFPQTFHLESVFHLVR